MWQLWAEGNTAKEIAGKIEPSLSPSTIYSWIMEYKDLPPKDLLVIYERDGLPDILLGKWKQYNDIYPQRISEISELISKRLETSRLQATAKDEKTIIKPPDCLEKDEDGCCWNASLRSDCGPCYFLTVGRTQWQVDLLLDLTRSLPERVQKAQEEFLKRDTEDRKH